MKIKEKDDAERKYFLLISNITFFISMICVLFMIMCIIGELIYTDHGFLGRSIIMSFPALVLLLISVLYSAKLKRLINGKIQS